MIKQFIRDSFIYTISVVLTRGISFLCLPLYLSVLSPSDFGVFDYIGVVGSFVLVVVTLEIAQGIHRYLPEVRDDVVEKRKFISTALIFTLACYAALIFLSAIFSNELVDIFLGPGEGELVVAAVTMFASNALLILVQAQLRSELRVKQHVVSSVIVAVCSAAFSVAALYWFEAGVIGMLISITCGNLIGFVYATTGTRHVYNLEFSPRHLKLLLGFSAPLVPSSLGVILALLIDRVMIKNMMSLDDLGVFGVAARFATLTTLLSMGVQQALTPLIYNRYREEGTPRDIARLFWLYCGLSVIAVGAIALVGPALLAVIAPPSYQGAASIVPLVCASALISKLYIFSPGLVIAKKTGVLSLINLAIGILSIALNFALIPAYGLVGAASGTLIAAVVGFAMNAVVAQRYYPIRYFPSAS